MTIHEFIRENRDTIDLSIRCVVTNSNFDIDDDEREMWIINDESLYNWARSEGVDV
jgi:hypothetical protein